MSPTIDLCDSSTDESCDSGFLAVKKGSTSSSSYTRYAKKGSTSSSSNTPYGKKGSTSPFSNAYGKKGSTSSSFSNTPAKKAVTNKNEPMTDLSSSKVTVSLYKTPNNTNLKRKSSTVHLLDAAAAVVTEEKAVAGKPTYRTNKKLKVKVDGSDDGGGGRLPLDVSLSLSAEDELERIKLEQDRQKDVRRKKVAVNKANHYAEQGGRDYKRELETDSPTRNAQVVADNQARKTEHGGYAHRDRSKSRIGAANKGNTSWNTGTSRSEDDKASISQGVNNRNNRLKLEGIIKWNKGRPASEHFDLDKFKKLEADIKKQRNAVGKARNSPVPSTRADAPNRQRKLDQMVALRDAICDPKRK